ncbi:MAG TPA: DUF4013 domain-containing protein [Herpetosiphonaceae bacterium]
MPSLKTALSTIHRDRQWWRKVLLGGALSLTVVGYPLVEGYQLESIENTQNGYPTPLPRWNELGTKAVQGIFAFVIDFFFFVFPVLFGGMLLLCSTLALSLAGLGGAGLQIFGTFGGVLLIGWFGFAWLSSVSPIGKRLYVSDGQPTQALSTKPLRLALDPEARAVYLQARLQSLPVYLVPLALLLVTIQSTGWSGWLTLLLLWLCLSALLYARLVTVQLYDAAARDIQRRRFEAFRERTRS